MIKLKTVNSETVRPLIKGGKRRYNDLFHTEYVNVFVVGRKQSGKTNVVGHIIKKEMKDDKDMILFVFSNTLKADPTWEKIQHKYKDRFFGYSSLDENPNEEGKGSFDQFYDYVFNQSKTDDDEDPQRFLVIFDDFSSELKDKRITNFLKQNRHGHCFNILSSQYPLDLPPAGRANINVWLLFPQIKEEKLEQIFHDSDPSITWDKFKKMYDFATAEKYNFLYADTSNGIFRKNFNKQFKLE